MQSLSTDFNISPLDISVNNLMQSLIRDKFCGYKVLSLEGNISLIDINNLQFEAIVFESLERIYFTRHPFRTLKEFKKFLENVLPKRYVKKILEGLDNSYENIVVMKKNFSDNNFLEGDYSGHNLYPFPQLKYLKKQEIRKFSNVASEPFDIPLYRSTKLVISSDKLDIKEFNKRIFKVDSSNIILPIHPLNLTDRKIKNTIKKHQLVRLKKSIKGRGLLSTRSVRLISGYDIKLSLNRRITSEKRNIFQAYSHNSPIYSKILEVVFSQKYPQLLIQSDICSIRLFDVVDAKYLTAIVRKSPPKGFVTLADYLRKLRSMPSEKNQKQLKHLFKDYLDKMVIFWKLFENDGVGLEPHLQNILVTVNRDFSLKKIIIRDIDGCYIENLNKYILKNKLHPLTNEITISKEQAKSKLINALFHNNIGEMIITMLILGFPRELALQIFYQFLKKNKLNIEEIKKHKLLLRMYVKDKEEYLFG